MRLYSWIIYQLNTQHVIQQYQPQVIITFIIITTIIPVVVIVIIMASITAYKHMALAEGFTRLYQ